MINLRAGLTASCGLLALALGASVATAQSTDTSSAPAGQSVVETTGIQDIVVTAQRRSEGVQSTPLRVTALNSQALQQRGQTSIADLAQNVPNLNMSQVSGRGRVYVRGGRPGYGDDGC